MSAGSSAEPNAASLDRLRRLAAFRPRIEEAGGSAEFREADVTDEDAMRSLFEGLDLDVLVNNAAYYAPLVTDKKRFDEIPAEEWDTVLAVNAKGTFLASKHALDAFDDGGSIVNISSSVVTMGVPGFLHYVASKGAVLAPHWITPLIPWTTAISISGWRWYGESSSLIGYSKARNE